MKSFKTFIREFPASWFAMIMGTGVFATATYLIGGRYHIQIMQDFAYFIVFFNFVMFFVLLVPFLAKLIFFRETVKKDFENPFKANFYVTLGVGMLSLATNFSVVTPIFPVYFVFWYTGTFTIITIETVLLFMAFMSTRIEIKHINPSWFLGTTGLLLIPGSGVWALHVETLKNLSQFLIDFSFGAGFFLFIGMFSTWIFRLLVHEPLKNEHIPLFWINLGPVGAALTSLMAYYLYLPHLRGVVTFFALLFFGTGAWWFLMASIVTIYYIHRLKIPYKTAWWSFTFPIGQFLVGSYLFDEHVECRSINEFLILLYTVLAVIWVANIVLMGRCIMKGNIRNAQNLNE